MSEIVKALVKAQQEISPPVKDKTNPMFKSSYCSLDSICEAIRVPLAKNGLNVSHSVTSTPEGKHTLVTTLSHVSGEKMETTMPMFVDKLTSQGFGSSLTYGKRYAVCSLLSLPSDEDDDGNAATKEQQSKEPGLSVEQWDTLKELIGDDIGLHERILLGYGVKNIKEIPAKNFSSLVSKLKNKEKK